MRIYDPKYSDRICKRKLEVKGWKQLETAIHFLMLLPSQVTRTEITTPKASVGANFY